MSDKVKTDRPGRLVCVCDARGRILLHAPYEYDDPAASKYKRGARGHGKAEGKAEQARGTECVKEQDA